MIRAFQWNLTALSLLALVVGMFLIYQTMTFSVVQRRPLIGSLRAINSAESTFSSSCGANGYAQSLDDLAKPPTGSTAGFISPDLNTNGVSKSGYIVTLAADTGAGKTLAGFLPTLADFCPSSLGGAAFTT